MDRGKLRASFNFLLCHGIAVLDPGQCLFSMDIFQPQIGISNFQAVLGQRATGRGQSDQDTDREVSIRLHQVFSKKITPNRIGVRGNCSVGRHSHCD